MLKKNIKKPEWYDFNNYKMTTRMTDYEWLEQLALRLSVRTSDPFCSHEEAPEIRAENIRLIEKYGVVPKSMITEAKFYFHCLSRLEAIQKFRGGAGVRELEIFEMLTIKMYAEKKLEGNAKAIDSRFGEYNRAFISVPLDDLDSHLIDQFKLWLDEIRKVKKAAIKKRQQLTWHNCYLLQYLDLSHWKKRNGIEISESELFRLASNGEERGTEDLFRKTTFTHAAQTMNLEFLLKYAQTIKTNQKIKKRK